MFVSTWEAGTVNDPDMSRNIAGLQRYGVKGVLIRAELQNLPRLLILLCCWWPTGGMLNSTLLLVSPTCRGCLEPTPSCIPASLCQIQLSNIPWAPVMISLLSPVQLWALITSPIAEKQEGHKWAVANTAGYIFSLLLPVGWMVDECSFIGS